MRIIYYWFLSFEFTVEFQFTVHVVVIHGSPLWFRSRHTRFCKCSFISLSRFFSVFLLPLAVSYFILNPVFVILLFSVSRVHLRLNVSFVQDLLRACDYKIHNASLKR